MSKEESKLKQRIYIAPESTNESQGVVPGGRMMLMYH